MAMITSVRAPIPVTEIPRQPRPAEVRAAADAKPAAGLPVAVPLRAGAVLQLQDKPGPSDLPLQAAQVSAAAAADAAKEAYIRASIAAGLSPLPLPRG